MSIASSCPFCCVYVDAMQTPAIMLSLLLGCTGDKNSSVTDDTGTPASDDTGTETALYTVLDDVLEPIRIDYGLPSLTAAVVEGSTLTKLGAVGLRSLDAKVEVTHEDRYHLGSCTKAMTATLTAVLVENGTLSWETTLAEAFP
ncbi:MAG: CubicO group peptidase (beta-lactamase class C family), partial [Myxococcota bacterium]